MIHHMPAIRGLWMKLLVAFISVAVRQGTVVDLNLSGLTSVPDDLPANVTHLLLRNNIIENIDNTSFARYQELIELDVKFSSLRHIGEGVFDKNTKLAKLTLYIHDDIVLPSGFGPAMHSLTEIVLYSGSARLHEILTYPYFAGFTKLYSILLQDITTTIPTNIISPTQEAFMCSGSEVTIFPHGFAFFPNLTRLEISYTDIEVLPASLTDLKFIKSIVLRGNRITHLPDISPIVNLVYLRLLYDKLSSISYMANPPPSLSKLWLDGNELTTLPEISGNIRLELEDNPLECNVSLCWIRLTSWMGSDIHVDDPAMCASPPALAGQLLMGIYPVTMECYLGRKSVCVVLIYQLQ